MLVVQRARALVFSAILIVAGILLYVPIALVMAMGLSFSRPRPAPAPGNFQPAPKPLKIVKRSQAV